MVVLINPRAGAGRAMRRWARVEPGLNALVGDFRRVMLEPGTCTAEAVSREVERGETEFVAAGGDGTVNAVGTALLALQSSNLRLGAVGLGSSNDFHKPLRRMIAGVPVRVDFDAAAPRDVLRIESAAAGSGAGEEALRIEAAAPKDVLRIEAPAPLSGAGEGEPTSRYAFINASVGVTAEANHLFNHPTPLLGRLKAWSPDCAVLHAALATIAGRRPEFLSIDAAEPTPVANLAVLLSTHCAGMLSYDPWLAPRSGHVTIAACLDMSPTRLLRVVVSLACGRFVGLPRTKTWEATRLTVSAARPVAVEADGEVFLAPDVTFRVLPGALAICP